MGNSQPKYITSLEALDIIGDETWDRLRKQLVRWRIPLDSQSNRVNNYNNNNNSNQGAIAMDYNYFAKIIYTHFPYIPKQLLDGLYLGFTLDLNAKIDVDDFITTLAVIAGQNKQQILRFLFRIYDIRGTGYLERVNVERLLRLAYGSKYNSDIEVINKHLDRLFQRQTTDSHDFRVPSSMLTLKDFESANVPLRELGEWVQIVLSVFTNPLPTKLLDLERRYSSIVTNKEMCDRYPVTDSECDQLRGVFSHLFGNLRRQPSVALNKLEMSLDMWRDVSENYLTPTLSTFVFLISSISLKPIWRLGEFIEFSFLFGKLDLEAQAKHLCEACHRHYRRYGRSTTQSLQSSMRRLVLLLAHGFAPSDSDSKLTNNKDTALNFSLESIESLEMRIFLPNTIREALEVIERIEEPPLNIYKDLIIQFNSYLPGLRDLCLLASCHFGVKPSDPLLEKEYIMELMVRRQFTAPQTRAQLYGPIGTEWCVIVRNWINHWKLYVGQKRLISNNDSANNLGTFSSNSPSNPPGEIDNWSILKKTGPKQLLQGIVLNHHIDVVAPNVYTALQMWYSGGPRIQRKVILTKRSTLITSELELFPLCLKICTCDNFGKARDTEREVLFSRMTTVQEVINELSEARRLESARVRLWNYAMTNWRDQFVLSPSLTLEEANLQDGQSLLLEVSLADGTWPRSQLHARLDDEEKSKQTIKRGSNEDDVNDSKETNQSKRLNDGKVGLDNLGNTCYLNSSLQALLHTKPLVDYFIRKQHLHDVNYYSKHGFNGRLALSFGRLIEELYSSSKKSMSPRLFVNDLITLHSQFSGNQQHDAQELLAVLLDGLSEDLNLVDEKPYTTQPDSDGRSDEVLADIWWDNHLQRDLSLVQALFMGQFKSLMTCDNCEYVSARFEPFNILALPLPEDQLRVFTVHIVHIGSAHAILAMVRVDKRSDLYALVDAVNKLQLNQDNECDKTDEATDMAITKPTTRYVAVEVINSRVNALLSLERKLEMIRDGENVFLYETAGFHRGLQRGNKSIQLPINDHQISRSNDLIIPTTTKENDDNNEIADITIGNRVSFVQRRVRYRSDPSQGTEAFVHDLFGLPFVEVIPSRVTGRYLYDLINERVGRYLKASISSLLEHYEGNLYSNSNYNPDISSYSTDDLVAGPINRVGFVLRIVIGGLGHCIGCARCSWLTGCQGCLLPDNTDIDISLRDGETIAIDWHVAVFEELLDSNSASDVRKHSSFNSKQNSENSTPLRRCLDKFTEDEPLEGVVCPKCKRDDKLRKSFAIWRCPPVLVVQLKRFQFDNTSRRKLNNRVDFPIDGLDLSPYIVPRSDRQTAISDCTEYDLYSSVHHIGALSGGHYVTTVRHKRDGSTEDDWLLYNDDVISELRDLRDLCSPTAYLLFYIRKDIKELNVDELFQPFRLRALPKKAVNSKHSKHLEVNTDNIRRNQINERNLITKYLPRLSITSASENVLTNRRGSNNYDPDNGGFCMPS